MKHFAAPWSKTLVAVSALTTLICVGLALMTRHLPAPAGIPVNWIRVLPIALILLAALFTIRGYVVTPDAILVQRLFWHTRLPRTGLERVEFLPAAMQRSIRICGNGGVFSFSGYYRNTKLGSYRAYVTDLQNTVVLHYQKRTVVISPADPEAFVAEINAQQHSASA